MSDDRLEKLLGGDALVGLRARLRAAYEAAPAGAVPPSRRLTGLSPHEREALATIAGQAPREAASLHIDPATIGKRLAAAGIARDLRDALERLDGPIRPVAAERADRAAAWSALLEAESEAAPALGRWLRAAPGHRGLLQRLAGGDTSGAAALLQRARRVLAALPAGGRPRARLAAETLGDAHALDDGAPVATLVLAVLRLGRPAPAAPDSAAPDRIDETGNEALPEVTGRAALASTHPGRVDGPRESTRAIWAAAGVSVNELARPALTLNLHMHDGEPAYWSLRRLLRAPPHWPVGGVRVLVCENPNLVAIAADALGPRAAPLVCTDGMPAAAQRALLGQLVARGALLAYHGDFDWPGIAIANLVRREFGTATWRMDAADYEQALVRHEDVAAPLAGAPVAPTWSPALGESMRRHGRALAEEAVSDDLLFDLDGGT